MAGSTSYFFLIILGFCLSDTQGQSSGDLRLVDSSRRTGVSSGRLEVYYRGQWGTVCNDRFGSNDATVACRQLGYTNHTNYGRVGYLGFSQASSTTRTWLDELDCRGTESRLIDCPANSIGYEDCTHTQDVALICTANEGDLRLVSSLGRTGVSSGRLEFYYNGQWGTVCNDRFDSNDAMVACRQLGYEGYSNYGRVGTLGSQTSSSTPTWLDELRCEGTENRLIECPANRIGVEDCTHTQDVALICTANGDLRLVGSLGRTGGSSGRLEFYYNGTWGTVCDDSFGSYDARVACRQLGYTGYTTQYGRVRTLGFSQASSSTRTWLDNLRCSGTESRLIDCPANAIGVEDCTHTQDVALICTTRNGFTTTSGGGDNGGSNVIAYSGGSAGSGTFGCIVICCCICCYLYIKKSNSSPPSRQNSPPLSTRKSVKMIVFAIKGDSPPPYTS
ncbi:soluble scavenger receptor cysteine-rich domain-containing protein SSC5D-like isoform X4 [Halichondria panicea]|uniref:soluble scavenger receptor cysteine-rich domain-containing protein SSC5D-like isoform X4 n=1 Tax=Halichondria panicea TaxID=6063 RepID=UPI00312B99E0